MAALTNAYLSLGGSDLSAYIRSISVPNEVAMLENTVMSTTGTTETNEAGLKKWRISVVFKADAAGAVETALSALIGAAPFVCIVKAANATTAATNPKWTGNGVLSSVNLIDGQVGALHEIPVEIVSAGTLTRATSDS